jgi:hypothetical protein
MVGDQVRVATATEDRADPTFSTQVGAGRARRSGSSRSAAGQVLSPPRPTRLPLALAVFRLAGTGRPPGIAIPTEWRAGRGS